MCVCVRRGKEGQKEKKVKNVHSKKKKGRKKKGQKRYKQKITQKQK